MDETAATRDGAGASEQPYNTVRTTTTTTTEDPHHAVEEESPTENSAGATQTTSLASTAAPDPGASLGTSENLRVSNTDTWNNIIHENQGFKESYSPNETSSSQREGNGGHHRRIPSTTTSSSAATVPVSFLSSSFVGNHQMEETSLFDDGLGVKELDPPLPPEVVSTPPSPPFTKTSVKTTPARPPVRPKTGVTADVSHALLRRVQTHPASRGASNHGGRDAALPSLSSSATSGNVSSSVLTGLSPPTTTTTSTPNNLATTPSMTGSTPAITTTTQGAKRVYRITPATAGPNGKSVAGGANHTATPGTSSSKLVTRDIAALDFLLGIPLAAEGRLVQQGWWQMQMSGLGTGAPSRGHSQHDPSIADPSETEIDADVGSIFRAAGGSGTVTPGRRMAKGRWWEKWIRQPSTAADASAVVGPPGAQHSYHSQQPYAALESVAGLVGGGPSATDLQGIAADWQNYPSKILRDENELEQPNPNERGSLGFMVAPPTSATGVQSPLLQQQYQEQQYVPGRRLQGDEAVRVQVPLTMSPTLTKHRSVARQAALREWELSTAHGLVEKGHPPMLDGRLFFSAGGAYPVSVFSIIRYEPKKEEMKQRRQKLEAMGGGGSHFVVPHRDWRGISYRSLLSQRSIKHDANSRAFNRFLRKDRQRRDTGDDEEEDETVSTTSSVSSEESEDGYVPGLLDDPRMVLGRHRHVMIGDRVTGPIVSSTIQFVKPTLLKAELNKQFRERFDGWEPPRAARKFIGARVVDGEYRLMDPTEEMVVYPDAASGPASTGGSSGRPRQGSVTSLSTSSGGDNGPPAATEKQIRMPPSLTLSKIRSLKRQALAAAVKAKLEIGSVALACVYFERLCLDCRVDKSNRRLSFAACLLLATKVNEPNLGLVMRQYKADTKNQDSNSMATRLQSLIRPNKRSKNMFASLLEFFTTDWNLSLKHLFDAEWGVFAALGFKLHAKPSHVAFHFKRLMKSLEWTPRKYLGPDMYDQWHTALENEEERRKEREKKRERQMRKREEQLLNLRLELEQEALRRKTEEREAAAAAAAAAAGQHHGEEAGSPAKRRRRRRRPQPAATNDTTTPAATATSSSSPAPPASQPAPLAAATTESTAKGVKKGSGRRFLNFSMRRILSQERIIETSNGAMVESTVANTDQGHENDDLQSAGEAVLGVEGGIAIDIPANFKDADDQSSMGSMLSNENGLLF